MRRFAESFSSVLGLHETIIVTVAFAWAIVALCRLRQRRSLTHWWRRAAWLPMALAILAAILSMIKTMYTLNILQEGQALNDVQRQLMVEKAVHSFVRVVLVGAVCSVLLAILGRLSPRTGRPNDSLET